MKKYSALQYLIYLLSKREYSQYELQQKLEQKEYLDSEVAAALEQVKVLNYQSDERFCANFIRYRSQQGYGPKRLKQELSFKGVNETIIHEGLSNSDIDWFTLAERVFCKKKPQIWDSKTKQKLWRYMISHGFDYDHFSHLMDNIADE